MSLGGFRPKRTSTSGPSFKFYGEGGSSFGCSFCVFDGFWLVRRGRRKKSGEPS